jgi:hypothetical protein
MKYTFEIMKEYEDAFKGISVYSVSEDKKLMVDFVAIEELEDAQKEIDEAYKRGLKDGKEYGSDKSDMREAVSYQRGLDDAWDAARKIVEMSDPPYWEVFDEYKNELFGKITASEAIEKLKAYEEKQKADELNVGDELEHTVSGYTSKAIFLEKIEDDEDWYKCLFWTGCGVTILSYPKSQFKRTGKHYDIDKILEEMKE